jgi:hypothetical protein
MIYRWEMECTLRRILRDVIVSSELGLLQLGWNIYRASPRLWNISQVSESMYVMYIGGELVHIQDLCDLIDIYWFLKETYRAEYLIRWLFYVGMPVSTHDASGSESVSSGSRFKRSDGAYLSPSYTSDWLFSKSHHLAILSNSIGPWRMTLGPTNEAIRRETMRKKLTG